MSVHTNPPSPDSSSSSPKCTPEANFQPSLSSNASVISSFSSPSLVPAPAPIRTITPPRSSSPDRTSPTTSGASLLPVWLPQRSSGNPPPELLGDRTPVVQSITQPGAQPGARHPMASSDDFEFGEELGGGSWSTVLEATYRPTSKRYAIKVLNKVQLSKKKMTAYAVVEKNALVLLSSGSHPGVVRLYSAFHDTTSLYLVLQLAPNGDLRELVKTFGSLSLSCARYYTAQLVDTVQWIHSKGVLHRDLKPENVLLDSAMRIKLTDFGSAYIAKDLNLAPRASTFVGTAAYVSPELLFGPVKTTSQSSDLWAIGCILYFLMIGQSPFLALNDYLSFKKIEVLDYTFPEGFDSDAMALIQRLLILEPSNRLGAHPKSSSSELRQHPFFVGNSLPGSVNHPEARINWETLWNDPPIEIESGLVQAPSREHGEGYAERLSWDNFIHDFSLVATEDPPNFPQEAQGKEHAEDVPVKRPLDPPINSFNGPSPLTPPTSVHARQAKNSSGSGSQRSPVDDLSERTSHQNSGSGDPEQAI